MLTNKKISAIIACYKDEQAIPIMYQRLKEVLSTTCAEYEIIFVNDGSPDNSQAVLEKIAKDDDCVIVITHSRNFGSQNVFTSGMEISSGYAGVLLDGELQDPPEIIKQFIPKWLEGNDIVYGIREKRKASILMQIAYKLFYCL